MKKASFFCFLLFLVATSEMQAVSASSTFTTLFMPKQYDSVPSSISIEQLRKYSESIKDIANELKQKYDPEGRVNKILSLFAPELFQKDVEGNQILAKISPSRIPALSDRIFLAAAITMGLASTLRMLDYTSTNPDLNKYIPALKSNTTNIIYLISAGLWLEGCMLLVDYFLEIGLRDGRIIYPAILRLIGSAIFTLQPMTSLLKGKRVYEDNNPENHLHWANFFGILFFLIANMISSVFLIQSTQKSDTRTFFQQNSKMISMVAFTLGTIFLFCADYQVRKETGVGESKAKIFTALGNTLIVSACSLFLFVEQPETTTTNNQTKS